MILPGISKVDGGIEEGVVDQPQELHGREDQTVWFLDRRDVVRRAIHLLADDVRACPPKLELVWDHLSVLQHPVADVELEIDLGAS